MMQSDLKVSLKPPLAAANVSLIKRHSLHAIEPLKRLDHLSRRGSHELIRKEESSSWGNLRLLDSKGRSASLAQLKTSGRTLSASNLAALSDSNLSIQVALPQRSYEYAGSESNLAKQSFEVVVKRYYEQLTVGCGNANCWNKFCASNCSIAKLNSRLASFVSIELASLGKEYFCKESGKKVPHLSLTNEQKPASLSKLASLVNEHEPASVSNERKPGLLTNEQKPTSLSKLASLGNEHEPASLSNECKRGLLTNEHKPASSACEKPVSFLHKFFSSSPFKFLFSNEPTLKASKKPRSCSLRDMQRTLTTSDSKSSLKLNAAKNEALLDEKQKGITLKSHVNTALDSNKKEVLGDKLPSPTLIDLQNGIENVDVDDAVLEEFEEQCVLEMSSSNLKELSLTHLTLPMLETSINNYEQCGDASFIINTIRTVFSSSDALNASFRKISTTNELHNSASFMTTSQTSERSELHLSAVRNAYKLLLDLKPKETFIRPLQNSAEIHLKTLQACNVQPSEVLQLVILLENPLVLKNNDLLQTFCSVIAKLEPMTRDSFVEILVDYDCASFQRVLKAVQRLLSSRIHTSQCSEPHIIMICMMLSTLHEANNATEKRPHSLVAISEFYNNEISQKLDYKLEYEKWRVRNEKPHGLSDAASSSLSILNFPFVLQPASKVRIMRIHAMRLMGLEYCDAILYQAKVNQAKKVYEDDEMTVEDSVKSAMSPFLVLEVRRDHLIEDTLVQVKLKENDLKKALKIRYVGGGEEGLDLGGLQKEFFHIIIDDIIQPDYGMFTYLEEVERMWINCSSSLELESHLLFELVGTLLGIAIYNGIILDLHFPPVIYKKLQGCKTELADLKDVEPSLARSLQSLLEYDGDVESTFCYTFQISRTIFDEARVINLKTNGENIAVTNENRMEFVHLYVDYLLNTSIAPQFEALARGFHKVCDVTCLKLVHPEELELLICGSPHIDFTSIEQSTTYDNGFNKTHPTILAFWDVVRSMNEDDKKRLLSFVTGSDRVPLKGLSSVAFQIVKQGEDSEKLPTALTCFNQLQLPEYCSKEKLQSRLYLAIQNSKGFGLT